MNFIAFVPLSGRALSIRAAATATIARQQCTIVTPSAINARDAPSSPASRFLSSNAPATADEAAANADANSEIETLDPAVLAKIYNHRRAHYNRSVSALRKQYRAEHLARVEREKRQRALEQSKLWRETLERRRLKAMRSAENAQKELEKRDRRLKEWEEELARTQKERDSKKELYKKARQKIVDDLEAECHLWLTTPEEVERALGNPIASQILWTRAGGMIGAPSGPKTGFGDHGDFWRYECHTWDARPIYKDPKELMLEEFENLSYLLANNNPKYWTKERVEEHERREQRARLRSIVRDEGRRSLLNKQREMMRDIYGNDPLGRKEGDGGGRLPPTVMPAPKLDYLADFEAQEREGVKIMMEDPRKFFIFESDLPNQSNLGKLHGSSHSTDSSEEGEAADSAPVIASIGASLGRPVSLRNPFFGDKPTPFPIKVGRDLPADTRTEKEKKRDERQERMRQAAEEAALAAKKGMSYEIAMAAEEDLDDGSEDVDYDQAEEDAEKELWVDQEDKWTAMDRKVFDMTPPCNRLTTDDVDWLIQEMQSRAGKLQQRIDFEERIRAKELEGRTSRPIESMDDVDRDVMQKLGYNMAKIEALVQDLTIEQQLALGDIDFTGRVDISAEEMKREISSVPGLTDDQVQELVKMEMSMLRDERLKNLNKIG